MMLIKVDKKDFEPIILESQARFIEDARKYGMKDVANVIAQTNAIIQIAKARDYNNEHIYIIQKCEEEIGVIWCIEDHIMDLYIDPKYRRKGLAKKALQEILNTHKKLGYTSTSLHVFTQNIPAYTLYKNMGFIVQHTTGTSTCMTLIF